MYDLIVYIGRFQIFHNGHKDVSQKISKMAKKTLILVGSIDSPRTIKNPFSFEEVKDMIKKSVHIQYLQVSGVQDYTYDINRWIEAVSKIIKDACPNGKVAIAGYKKDNTSNYLDYFPQYDFIEMNSYHHYGDLVNASDLRNLYFEGKLGFIQNYMPIPVFNKLLEFKTKKEYIELQDEYNFNKDHKSQWDTPFPSIFVTTDALVVQSGHLLLIKRKNNPGKGLWAMPGGYIKVDEDIKTSMIRELNEETNIHLQDEILERNIENVKIFDSPDRSMRGRIITHVYLIVLDDSKPLPKVVGGDDAEEAEWVPIGDFYNMRKTMFSDHYHIIESMI